jgi:GDP-D-mannose dehydratase
MVNEKFQNLSKEIEYNNRYPVIIKHEVTSPTANKVYLPDTSKAKKELSLDLKFNLDEAVLNTLCYYGLQLNSIDY